MTDDERRARELFDAAREKSGTDGDDAALSLYLESLALDRRQPSALYNVGLIYKYRGDWKQSLRYNQMAVELRPDDEATNWNLGIAATALREWRIAREAWRRAGIKLDAGDDPIDQNFGYTPVRLNGFPGSEGQAEVVWAHRRSPVTARISNIPTPQARFQYGDVVLHDGAANGTRFFEPGDERPVFDVFGLFSASAFTTFDLDLVAPDESALAALATACDHAKVEMEDWTQSIQYLCKECSEGRAHEHHDHSNLAVGWQRERRIGLASDDAARVDAILAQWMAGGDERAYSYRST